MLYHFSLLLLLLPSTGALRVQRTAPARMGISSYGGRGMAWDAARGLYMAVCCWHSNARTGLQSASGTRE